MGIRCQITFILKDENYEQTEFYNKAVEKRTIYQHSSGAPEEVIPKLREFAKWYNNNNFTDIEYLSANYLYYSKMMVRKHFAKRFAKEKKYLDGLVQSGYGICAPEELHGDLSFYYEVITTISHKDNVKPYTVIKSYKVPSESFMKKIEVSDLVLIDTVPLHTRATIEKEEGEIVR